MPGYQFKHGCCSEVGFLIYLDGQAKDWVGTWHTDEDSLRMLVRWTLATGGNANTIRVGSFWSVNGECRITFDRFDEDVATGSIRCDGISGEYSDGGTRAEGVVELLAVDSFVFDPTPYIPGTTPSPT